MKKFIQTYVIVLIIMECFLFFGGYMLFDFRQRFYIAGAVSALVIAIIISAFITQSEKIEELEKRIQTLENHMDKSV